MTDTIIDISHLSHFYGEYIAVDDISFTVKRGEIFALLGTNGAGKTTTLEIIEGLRTPSSGEVRVFGKNPSDRASLRARQGIMLQDISMPSELTVLECMKLFASLSGREGDIDYSLACVDLRHKTSTQVGQLSGGERRRLDFATAIFGSPELLFMDEPTTGLDPEARHKLWEVVGGLRAEGMTILLTTHYLEEAEQFADRIAIMHRGVLERLGTMQELVKQEETLISYHGPWTNTLEQLGLTPDKSNIHTLSTLNPGLFLREFSDRLSLGEVEARNLEVRRPSLNMIFESVSHSQEMPA